jgi:hypothetical protein
MVWYAFLECWATLYPEYPDKIRTDQGTQYKSPRWKELTDALGLELILSGVESHNSIGPGERYHGRLRRIFRKVRYDYPNLTPDISLRLVVKAMNDTMNPECLVPSYLVFGILPRFPALNSKLPTQIYRMKALEAARAEMETIISELRVRRALSANIPTASTKSYSAGQKVLVYGDNESPHWQGPYKIIRIENKQVYFDLNGKEVQHSISQIKPYIDSVNDESLNTLYCMLKPLYSKQQRPIEVYLTETLHPADPRGIN